MRRKKTKKRKGFTLVELLVVIVIISMLAAFVVPRMLKKLGGAQKDIAKAKMAIIEGALGMFRNDCGRYPDDTEGLEANTPETFDIYAIQERNSLHKVKGSYCSLWQHWLERGLHWAV